MRNSNNNGFVLIEACLSLLCIALAVMLIHAALSTYAHSKQLPNHTDEEEEVLKEIYES